VSGESSIGVMGVIGIGDMGIAWNGDIGAIGLVASNGPVAFLMGACGGGGGGGGGRPCITAIVPPSAPFGFAAFGGGDFTGGVSGLLMGLTGTRWVRLLVVGVLPTWFPPGITDPPFGGLCALTVPPALLASRGSDPLLLV
jgi:hypothetical protein